MLTHCACGFTPVDEDAGVGGGGGEATGGGATGGGTATGGGPEGGGAATGGGTATGGGGGGGDVDAGEADAGEADAGEVDAGEVDAGELDAGEPDAGLSCVGRDGAACLNGTQRGLCSGGVCGGCGTNDQACTMAYGSTVNRYLCIADECAPGECRADNDCAAIGKVGQICGVASPNQCGQCTTDSQCQVSSYGANTICNPTVGVCVPNTCSTPNATCAANPADVCCGTTCRAGDCCSTAQCTNGATCVNNSCTTCAAVANNTYYVDPIAGSDTGLNGSANCPFKSLSRGVQYINGVFGAAIPAGTKLVLRNDSTFARGERYPIQVPMNVTVESEDAGTRSTVIVPAATTGFVLGATGSSLRSLVIEGVDGGANNTGIRIATGSDTTTRITDVTVTNCRASGIRSEGGSVSLGAGVVATRNGDPNGTSAGLFVSGGAVTVSVAAGQTPTRFDQNRGNGILITGAGRLTLTGVPDLTGYPANQNPPAVATGAGTITANENQAANFAMAGSTTAMQSDINGLVTWGGQGNGMNVAAGSNVMIRNSVSVKNRNNGVLVNPGGIAAVTSINLGNATAPGLNVFQAPVNGNLGAGICVGNFANSAQTVEARGNSFANKSCAALTSPITQLTTTRAGCLSRDGGVDVGIELTFGNNPQPNVRVTLDACTNL